MTNPSPFPAPDKPFLIPGMTGSQFDYDYHMVLAEHLLAQTFHSLIMAAMIRGDSQARLELARAFPEISADLRARGHLEMPDTTQKEK